MSHLAETKKGDITIRKVNIDGQSALRIGNTYYHYDERLERFSPGENQTDDVINRLLSQSIKCDEPVEDSDYIALAEKLVYSFLDTLKSETGKYALKNTPKLTEITVRTKMLTAGKIFRAFSGSGSFKGAGITVRVPQGYVFQYEKIFKGSGRLNAHARVQVDA